MKSFNDVIPLTLVILALVAITYALVSHEQATKALGVDVQSLVSIVSIIDDRVDDLEAQNIKTVEIQVERFWDDDAKQYDYKLVGVKEE